MLLLPFAKLRAMALVAAVLMTGCAPVIGPAVEDARIAMRVRTVLVNDPDLGTQPIDVRVDAGVVTLTGVVRSDAEARRAVELARGVQGVVDVTPALQVGATPAGAGVLPPESGAALPRDTLRRLAALGASVTGARTHEAGLGNAMGGGPIVRLPNRNGWAPAVGFSWTEVEIETGPRGDPGLARLRIRPVMAGLSYSRAHGRAALSASLVGGYAFNSLAVHRGEAGPGRAVAARGSLAWRPGVSGWYDVSPRVGVNLFVGGLFARPRVTFARDDLVWTERIRADALIVSVGLAYWLF